MARPVRCKRIPKHTTPLRWPDALLTNHSQTLVVWSGRLRGRTNGVLSHEGILALQRGEDVNYYVSDLTVKTLNGYKFTHTVVLSVWITIIGIYT